MALEILDYPILNEDKIPRRRVLLARCELISVVDFNKEITLVILGCNAEGAGLSCQTTIEKSEASDTEKLMEVIPVSWKTALDQDESYFQPGEIAVFSYTTESNFDRHCVVRNLGEAALGPK